MPLLRRQPFRRKAPPQDLDPDEEIFYCHLTKEAFRDYEEFFERAILCNSLVWSCALTGRPNLTYQEAVDSENKARQTLRKFPKILKGAVLFLVNLTSRSRHVDLCDDIFNFVKDRYFIGELVEVNLEEGWVHCQISRVIPPSEAKLKEYSGKGQSRGEKREDKFWPPSDLYDYVVEEIPDQSEDSDSDDVMTVNYVTVPATVIRRDKSFFNREKNKLFLKQSTEMNMSSGVWRVKNRFLQKYKLNTAQFSDFFAGPNPNFEETAGKNRTSISMKSTMKGKGGAGKQKRSKKLDKSPKKKSLSSDQNQKSITDYFGGNKMPKKKKPDREENGDKKKKKKQEAVASWQQIEKEMEKMREDQKMKQHLKEEMKQRRLEERAKEREQRQETKKLFADYCRNYMKLRDDLECEDLKDIPSPAAIQCCIPNHLFGDFMMVLELIAAFKDILDVRTYFPAGLTFELLERALLEKELEGPLNDILQMLLSTIFREQDQEDDEVRETKETVNLTVDDSGESVNVLAAIQAASSAAGWAMKYEGQPLRKLTLDAFTLTEILRLHLLSSGGRSSERNAKWRYQQRGGYRNSDDPGLIFRFEESAILKSLKYSTVFHLSSGEKLKIINCLLNQILSYTGIRDLLDDRIEKLRHIKNDLRLLQLSERKRDQETILKIKEEKREKKKAAEEAKEKVQNEKTQKEKENNDGEEAKEEETKKLKQEKEEARKKADFQKKQSSYMNDIYKLQFLTSLAPIGRDRAFRRFWIFDSTPGLFVEHDDDFVGKCLPVPTPYHPEMNPFTGSVSVNNIKQVLKKGKICYDKNGNSDKENEADENTHLKETTRTYPSKKLLSAQNHKVPGTADTEASGNSSIGEKKAEAVAGVAAQTEIKKSTAETKEQKEVPSIFGMCSANPETCEVHSTILPRTHWAYYSEPDQVEALIESLNIRGVRESELRQALVQDKERLLDRLSACPVHKLDHTQEPRDIMDQRKSHRHVKKVNYSNTSLGYPPGTPLERIMELTLRDTILELEERIFMGGLGVLKVREREKWRSAIEEGQYDRQCSKLLWGGKQQEQIEEEMEDESCNSSVVNGEEDDDSTAPSRSESPTCPPVIYDLSCAVLQVAQSINVKYLVKPLGEDEKEKKKRQKREENLRKQTDKEIDDDDVKSTEAKLSKKVKCSRFELWETALMASNSTSQIYLHLSTLEQSIAWSRSALNASCKVCRKKRDPEQMLLCDGCNCGFHMYCLKPVLTKVPESEWFCLSCRPKEIPKSPRKSRRLFSEESEEEDDESSEEESEEEEENEEEEEEGEEEEEAEDEEDETEAEQESEDENEDDDACCVCEKGGHLICCETCPLVYHLTCATPPLKKVPRGKWMCHMCRPEEEEEEKPTKIKLSVRKFNPKGKSATKSSRPSTPVTNDHSSKRTSASGSRRSTRQNSPVSETHGKRKCASEAANKISRAVKKLRNSLDSEGPEEPDRPVRARMARRRFFEESDGQLQYTALTELLTKLTKHEEAWPFMRPVTKSDAPDYLEIIKKPMDFTTIHWKLDGMKYSTNSEMLADMLLVFENCEMYNQTNTSEYKAGITLRKFFEKESKKLGLKLEDVQTGPSIKRLRRNQ